LLAQSHYDRSLPGVTVAVGDQFPSAIRAAITAALPLAGVAYSDDAGTPSSSVVLAPACFITDHGPPTAVSLYLPLLPQTAAR
jgi:hypothetical protein